MQKKPKLGLFRKITGLHKKELSNSRENEAIGLQKKEVHINKKKFVPYVRPSMDELNKFLLFGVILVLFGFLVSSFNLDGSWQWVLWIGGAVIAINAFWLRFNFAQPFVWKYILTMMKTKHFINFIKNMAHHAKWFEYVCLGGMFLGFGIFGVDYWFYNRKKELGQKVSRGKRATIILFSAIVLALLFFFTMPIVYSVPILQPLFWPSLVAFVFLGFGGMSLMILLGYGVLSVLSIFEAKQLCPSIAPVIPGAPIPGFGVAIPLIGWVSLVIVLVVHEFSHGIMMAYYKEKIKSVGVLLAGIIPLGAFVEQDDETFEKLDDKKSLMVLSAGSASNLLTIPIALLVLFGFLFAVAPFVSNINSEYAKAYDGVVITKVNDYVSLCGTDVNSPAKGKLFAGDVIKQLNGVDINSLTVVSAVFSKSKGDLNFTVLRLSRDTNDLVDVNVSVTPYTFVDLGVKKVGADFAAVPTGYVIGHSIEVGQFLIGNITMILLLLVVIAFAAGSFNYFPADPFDGGRMAKIILLPYFGFLGFNKKETQKFIGRFFVWLLLVALLLNMIPYATMI